MLTRNLNWLRLLGILSCAFLVGCPGANSTSNAGATVSGTVMLDGSPVEGATVTFRPESPDGSGAFGMTDAEGKYVLNTSSAVLGVVPGTYKVSVTKMEAAASDAPAEDDPSYGGAPKQQAAPKHLLPEKYSRIESSGLTADVKPGENTVPLELKK